MVAKLNIVVIEDNDDLRELTCQVLSQEGHRVMGLSCAEELEDIAGGEPADLFLIAINLPETSDCLTRVKAFTVSTSTVPARADFTIPSEVPVPLTSIKTLSPGSAWPTDL